MRYNFKRQFGKNHAFYRNQNFGIVIFNHKKIPSVRHITTVTWMLGYNNQNKKKQVKYLLINISKIGNADITLTTKRKFISAYYLYL